MLRTPLKNTKNVYVNKPFKSPFESPAHREQSCKKAKQKSDAAQSPLSTRNKEAKRVLLLDDNEKEKKRRKLSENKDPKSFETNKNQNTSQSNEDQKLKENRKDQDLKESRKGQDLMESRKDQDLKDLKESRKDQDLKDLKESRKDQDLKDLKESRKDQDLKDVKESQCDKDVEKIVEEGTKNDLQTLKRKIFELRQELDCLKSKQRCTIKHSPDDLKVSIKRWRQACQNALETLCSELAERNGQSYKISDILKQLNIPETIVHYSEKDDSFI